MRIIRKLTPQDAHLLLPIADASLVGEDVLLRIGRSGFSLGYVPMARAEWRSFPADYAADPQRLLNQPNAALFAAFEDDVFIGQAAVQADPVSGWTRILDIRVDAAQRRTGVASALLRACEDFSDKHGMHGLCIHVPDSNPAACQFCEHCGFTLQGLDRSALIYTDAERDKPLARRSCLLFFYLLHQKG